MEVNSYSGRIEKFSGRPGTISLREFKVTFSTVVCELEHKYGANYTEAFAFKQLAHYVHYEALDVYKQHSPRILGVTQIPNPAYGTAITIASQAALQVAITHHGTVPNNPDPVPTSVVLSPQQFIAATANIPPTINAPAFADPMPVGEFFRILELEFPIKSTEKILQLATFSRQKDETLKMLYRRLLNSKRIPRASPTWKLPTGIFVRWKVLQHSMRKFSNGSLQNLETCILCLMCTTFQKSWNWPMHTMRPVL
jgi:hypothetical protein